VLGKTGRKKAPFEDSEPAGIQARNGTWGGGRGGVGGVGGGGGGGKAWRSEGGGGAGGGGGGGRGWRGGGGVAGAVGGWVGDGGGGSPLHAHGVPPEIGVACPGQTSWITYSLLSHLVLFTV